MTRDPATLKALLARVQRSAGPDRDLDEALMVLAYVKDRRHIGAQRDDGYGRWYDVKDDVWVDPVTDKWVTTSALFFTKSIDAALALVERLLPGAYWSIDHTDEGDPGKWYDVEIGQSFAQARTAPLAILAALLTALLAQPEGTETK